MPPCWSTGEYEKKSLYLQVTPMLGVRVLVLLLEPGDYFRKGCCLRRKRSYPVMTYVLISFFI